MDATTRKREAIKKVIKWSNGTVMVFLASGEQEPSLQGRYEDVKERVLAAATPETIFVHGLWGVGMDPVSREEW